MNGDEIVQSELQEFNNTLSLEDIEEPAEKISFDAVYSALQISLKFFRETVGCNFQES